MMLDSADHLWYTIHHVILPPQLPGTGEDKNAVSKDVYLLKYLSQQLHSCAAAVDNDYSRDILEAQATIDNLRQILDDLGQIHEEHLDEALSTLCLKGGILPIPIPSQNAALVVSKKFSDLIFEAFELCPPNEVIVSTKGRLARCFPDTAVAVDLTTFQANGFQTTIAETIAKMGSQAVAEMMPKIEKAKQDHLETRDTNDPSVVTGYLMRVLEAAGRAVQVPVVWKNTRDEVLYSSGMLPWRRSSIWLLARVAIQLQLKRATGSNDCYKIVMIFLLNTILSDAREKDLPSHILHCIISKISRRLLKMENRSLGGKWDEIVQTNLAKTISSMEQQWGMINKGSDPRLRLSRLEQLTPASDTEMGLEELDDFLGLLRALPGTSFSKHFTPAHMQFNHPTDTLPRVGSFVAQNDQVLSLAAFEHWVVLNLEGWVARRLEDDGTCLELTGAIKDYHSCASSQYRNNPENLSTMILTILELWIACDKVAARKHPMVLDYDTPIPKELFQSLILPLKDDMERLSRIEGFLQKRRSRSKFECSYIFMKFDDCSGFGVRHFQQSPEHQQLRASIEARAQVERRNKLQELAELKRVYNTLMDKYYESECEYIWVHPRYGPSYQTHSSSCSKCSYRDQANAMQIQVHEWPLPPADLAASAVVFELHCPPVFGAWRELTLFVVLDVLRSSYSVRENGNELYGIDHFLSPFRTHYGSSRLVLRSRTRPHTATHFARIDVAVATEADVCVNNGLSFHFYDSDNGCFTTELRPTEDLAALCTYQLQKAKVLQKFIYRPASCPNGPDPNCVIAAQHACPEHMKLDEFRCLAALPFGTQLQWSNILVQLAAPFIDFKNVDTGLVLLQAACQAGPPAQDGAVLRESHQDLLIQGFCKQLIQALEDGLGRIRENWESAQSLSSFVALAARLLSLTSSANIQTRCLEYLNDCRQTAAGWVSLMRKKYRESTEEAQRSDFLLQIFEICHICVSTFLLGESHLEGVLKVPSSAAILIASSIAIQQTAWAAFDSGSYLHGIWRQRWKRLCLRAFPLLADEIVRKKSNCLDDAVLQVWQTYSPSVGGWKLLRRGDPWLTTTLSAGDSSGGVQTVHFNLVTAELLVDGLPLSRLPATYEEHPVYKILFGRVMLEAIRSTMQGMQFTTLRTYHDYALHFGRGPNTASGNGRKTTENDLLVTCTCGDKTMSYVPHRLFQGNLPHHFVSSYLHWYQWAEDIVEFRPISDPWNSDKTQWILKRTTNGWTLGKADENVSLMSMKSTTGQTMAHLFRHVESATYLHVTWHTAETMLNIDLPRLKLMFLIKQDMPKRVLSREYRGMYLADNIRLGTLVGLKSKIVLVNDEGERMVLIPDGSISWQREKNDHVQVNINKETVKRVLPFTIDTCLGRLVDNGDLYSMLTRCYLHAVTAHCLPDSLTRKTGTEQALVILRSAAVRSFDKLKPGEVTLLRLIAALAPMRSYHPSFAHVMQAITWDTHLSPIAQHADLYREAKSILKYAASLNVFYETKLEGLGDLNRGEEFLHERDLIRSGTYRRSTFGAEYFQTKDDGIFKSRKSELSAGIASRAHAAFVTASGIFKNVQSTRYPVPKRWAEHLWGIFDIALQMRSSRAQLDKQVIGYDAGHVQEWRRTITMHLLQIHRTLQQQNLDGSDRLRYAIFVASLAFANKVDQHAIQLLMALGNVSELRAVTVPDTIDLELGKGYSLSKLGVEKALRRHLTQFKKPSANVLHRGVPEETQNLRDEFIDEQQTSLARYVKHFVSQWPCSIPCQPRGHMDKKYIHADEAMKTMSKIFKRRWNNLLVFNYLKQLEVILLQLSHAPVPESVLRMTKAKRSNARFCLPYISEANLLSGQPPIVGSVLPSLRRLGISNSDKGNTRNRGREESKGLQTVVSRLEAQATRQHERDYVHALRKSVASLEQHRTEIAPIRMNDERKALLQKHHSDCQEHLDEVWNAIAMAACGGITLRSGCPLEEGDKVFAYVAPQISPVLFLQQLSRSRWTSLAPDWKKAILDYGLAMAALQRAKRLLAVSRNPLDLAKELENDGHRNWEPTEYPESLLIEVESGILIREVQEEIAMQMRSPPNEENSVVQLHMGEGKSSVIVPIVASALANGNRLVRVIVAKPQSRQMRQMLVSKLGGLCDRQVYHMPFSRSLRLSGHEVQNISQIYQNCKAQGGVLLVQPEHILSFKLMGVESMLSGQLDVARPLLRLQHFFDNWSRDIVDESDENFSPKFELIYTIGMQRPIELAPDRWTLVQLVLGIVGRLALEVQAHLPLAVEVEQRAPAGSFARLRLLTDEAAEYLKCRVATEICDSSLPGFPISRQPDTTHQSVYTYITKAQLTDAEIAAVEQNVGFWTETTRGCGLLIRGLLAGGVLAFALVRKRWRVNYGPDNSRKPPTRLAVPFRAKDSPSPRSEFSHPEVVTVLTCLSHYYAGLKDDDIFLAFNYLFRSDEAESEYDSWVRDCPSLPTAFRNLEGVNLKDRRQCTQAVFPYLSRSKAVIDYFLSKIVFAREMREFPHKLSASGWDIGQRKPEPTTGFSGTNDSQHLLPLDVMYCDLERQAHTNALVLQYLLRIENTVKFMPPAPAEAQLTDADHLLGLITTMNAASTQPSVEVIIDVGSQILEMSNIQVAKKWLQLTASNTGHAQKQAVVFFNDDDELSVVDRKGCVELLQISPFSRQLDSCLVFLDEAHTRGTDLRLLEHYRAAVTLGANLTKDRLVQACMRMRKLGKGQSVVFYISEEIQTKILAAISATDRASIGVADVLIWSMQETHKDLRASIPLWASQGARFERQASLWQEARRGETYELSKEIAEGFLEEEAVSLQKRYKPNRHDGNMCEALSHLNLNDSNDPNHSKIIARCIEFDCHMSGSTVTLLEEEQERELSPEVEQERQVERPPPAEPLKHQLHPDVKTLICSGRISSSSAAFIPAFHVLRSTTLATLFDLDKFPSRLLVTSDFARTVEPPKHVGDTSTALDAFQRPVQWVVTSTDREGVVQHVVVLSPYEAQAMMPILRSTSPVPKASLHLYAPRQKWAFQPLDGLDLHTLPAAPYRDRAWLLPDSRRLQLNLFAGQLYHNCFRDYTLTSDYLNLAWRKPSKTAPRDAPALDIQADGFIVPSDAEQRPAQGSEGQLSVPSRQFFTSPIPLIRELLTKIRHDCDPIDRTHWGRVLQGEQLSNLDFEAMKL